MIYKKSLNRACPYYLVDALVVYPGYQLLPLLLFSV